MSKYSILITGTGGCGVGEGLYKSLEGIADYEIFSCNNSDNSLFLFNRPENSFIVCSANDPNYCKVILKICKENHIKVILPGSEPELVALVSQREMFEEQGILVFANTDKVINTFDNKWETFLQLKELGVKTPDTTTDINDQLFFEKNSFPLIVKPIIGNASKNVFIVNHLDELKSIKLYLDLKRIPFVIQQHIGNAKEEYTISVLSDFDGNYLGSIVLKRILAGGFSQFVQCESYTEIDQIAQDIGKKVNSKGPLNIQCRLMDGELYVFEINPRFSGTTPFRSLLGFNEAAILLGKVRHNINSYKREAIKFGYFGVRGFQEEIYNNNIRSKVSQY